MGKMGCAVLRETYQIAHLILHLPGLLQGSAFVDPENRIRVETESSTTNADALTL
jgi:hypothetical protein